MVDSVLAILAGGLSRRFQTKNSLWQDKALISVDNIPLLVHLLEKGKDHYQEICVSVNSFSREKKYRKTLEIFKDKSMPNFVIDRENTQLQGVFLGMNTVMKRYSDKSIQFIPSDRPFIEFEILDKMKVEKTSVSVLYYENGMIEPLLALYGPQCYFPKQFERLPLSRGDVLIRLSPRLRLYNVSKIIEENNLPNYIFENINIQEDLKKIRQDDFDLKEIKISEPKIISREKPMKFDFSNDETDFFEFIQKLISKSNFYSAFLWTEFCHSCSLISKEVFLDLGKRALKEEHEYWTNENLPFLALHSLQDLVIIFPEENNGKNKKKIAELQVQLNIITRGE